MELTECYSESDIVNMVRRRIEKKGDGLCTGDAITAGDWLVERTPGWVCTWREYLLDRDEVDLAVAMRLHESTGRPMGEQGFIKQLERRLARKLLPEKPGRPKNPENQYAACR